MKSLVGLLILVVAFCGVALAQVLAPPDFTREFARGLTSALPSSTVTVKADLELTVKDPDGTSRSIFLTNPYRDYAQDPKRLGELVRAFAAAMARPRTAPGKLDHSRIVPVIKDRQWLVDVDNTLRARGAVQEHLSEPYNNELVIVYAEDDPTRMRYLLTSEVAGIDRRELRSLAIENLKRILPRIEMRVDEGVSLISAGGDYEASLLLIDDIWSGGQIKVKGDIVVAVPARDVLLVTGSRNRSGLKRMRELAPKLMAQGPHGLTDILFVYRNGRFSKFGR